MSRDFLFPLSFLSLRTPTFSPVCAGLASVFATQFQPKQGDAWLYAFTGVRLGYQTAGPLLRLTSAAS